MIATVISTTIDDSKSGDGKVVSCECEMSEKEDIKTVEVVAGHGRMVFPKAGSKLIGMRLQSGYIVAVACDDGIEPDIEEGEHKIYSIGPDGAVAASVLMKADGSIVLNDGTDYAILYSEMKKAFDDLANFVKNHIHTTTATVGIGSVGTISKPKAWVPISMSSAKCEKVRI